MTTPRRVALLISIVIACIVAGIAYKIVRTIQLVPDAYMAWDTGTLLVEYMKRHDDRWPQSWNDLISMIESDTQKQIPIRGTESGDIKYVRSLEHAVQINWNFDPANPAAQNPVVPVGGGGFRVVFKGAEPNEIVREYLNQRAVTRPAAVR